MKPQLVIALTALLVLAPSAGAVNINQSAEWVRTLNRNASIEADAAHFNPAGLAFLPHDGLYIAASNQLVFQTLKVTDKSQLMLQYEPATHEGTVQAPVFPDLHAAYKRGDLAAFFTFMPIGGGGGGLFEQGTPSLDIMLVDALSQSGLYPLQTYERELYFKGSEFVLAGTLGAAYKLSGTLAIAAGYRLLYGTRAYDGYFRNVTAISGNALWDSLIAAGFSDTELALKASGLGHGFVLGVSAQPTAGLQVGLRAEYFLPQVLTNETEITTTSQSVRSLLEATPYGDGYETKITQPPQVHLGVSYQLTPDLRAELGSAVHLMAMRDLDGKEDGYRTRLDLGLALEYRALEALKVSAGWLYASPEALPAARSALEFGLPAHTAGLGATYTIIPALDVTLAGMWTEYLTLDSRSSEALDSDGQRGLQTYQKRSLAGALGVTYRWQP